MAAATVGCDVVDCAEDIAHHDAVRGVADFVGARVSFRLVELPVAEEAVVLAPKLAAVGGLDLLRAACDVPEACTGLG